MVNKDFYSRALVLYLRYVQNNSLQDTVVTGFN